MVNKRRRFGMVRKLPSGRYQAAYADPRSGKRTVGPMTFHTKTAANHWLTDVEADLNRGELPDLSLGRMTFKEWAEQWLMTRQIQPKTRARYKSTVCGILIPEFGFRRMNSITRNDVVNFIAEMSSDDGGESKAADARRFLSMIFAEAVRSNAIRTNPADGVRVRRRAKEEMVFLKREQVRAIADSISFKTITFRGGHVQRIECPTYGLLVRFVSETGLRAGEVAALKVGRIDIARCRVHVVESVSEVSLADAPGGLRYGATKNYERRSVPLPARIAEELIEHLESLPDDPDAFLFTSVKGEPIRHTNFYERHYKPAVVAANGVPNETRFHDLRHTYAALLIAAGANPLTVKQRMGHSSITVTMDRYGHLFPHLEEEITERMDAGYRAVQDELSPSDSARGVHGPKNLPDDTTKNRP